MHILINKMSGMIRPEEDKITLECRGVHEILCETYSRNGHIKNNNKGSY